MRSLLAGICVVGLWTSAALPASAAWDNVFQPTLFGRLRQPNVTNYYAPPAVVNYSPVVAQSAPCDNCQPQPQQQCSTSYVQRCYYQPVTTYQTKTYYEPVTTYRTSYYYEPVCSYRYSCYYDPCTCSYQQVAVPTTSYMLRAQNCPVQSWAARCVQEPVTTQQKVFYWQPQTTCCSTTMGAPIPSAPAPVMPSAQFTPSAPPQVQAAPSMTPIPENKPEISIHRSPPPSSQKPPQWDQMYPPMEKAPEIRSTGPTTSWQPRLEGPVPVQPTAPPAPPVKFDRMTVGPNSKVEGQVVRSDSSPKANAKILFINAGTGQRQTILANGAGRFQLDLASGSWHVYLHGADEIPVHHSRIDVNAAQPRLVNLVSRSN